MRPERFLLILTAGLWLSGCATPFADRSADESGSHQAETANDTSRDIAPRPASLATPAVHKPAAQTAEPQPDTAELANLANQPAPYPDDLWQRIRSGFALEGMDHENVTPQLNYYSRHPEYMDRVAERAAPYLHYIVDEVERRGLPMEVALLPVVESAYRPFAYSHGRAAGIWQFIPGTGLHYGLQQTWWYDGRRDVIASTDAALTYLDYLQELFDGDWQLAFAAYNAGQGTVMRAIRRNRELGRPTDYWSLPLPRETRNYVPRLLAVRALVEDPRLFDLELISIPDTPFLSVVDVGSQIDLALAAELADISMEQLYQLNPGYNRWATDPAGPHRLAIPLDRELQFKTALAKVPTSQRVRWQRHRVAPGETLGHIAKRYGSTVGVIQQANQIRGHIIRAGDHVLVPTSSQPSGHYALGADQRLARNQDRKREGNRVDHTVNRGDTFWDLSRRYKVQVRDLAAWNNMAPGDTLRPGQPLVIWTQLAVHSTPASQPAQGGPALQRIRYTVRKGDSLSRIAQRFRVSIADLRSWNGLGQGGYLQPGQQLTLHVDVRRQSGDS